MKLNLAFALLTSSLLLGACTPNAPIGTTNPTTPTNLPSSLLQTQANPVGALSRAGWSVRAAPQGVGVQGANIIFDGDPGTFWVTPNSQNNSMSLQVDLGSVQDFDGIVLESGPNSPNFLRSYNIYVSSNTNSWGPWVAGGEKLTTQKLERKFPAQKGRYVTVQVGYDLPGKPWNLAEFWLTSSQANPNPNPNPNPTSRDAWTWPFAQDSIWNMPIGSGARYVDADLGPIGAIIPDLEYLYRSKASDPLQKVYLPGTSGTSRVDENQTTSFLSVRIPDDYIVADITLEPYSTPNNCTAILAPDGRTLTELQPFTRPTRGGKVWAYNPSIENFQTLQDIRGPGSFGAHFGSTMSTLGGSIRPGEMSGPDPIRHAIKLELNTEQLWKDPSNPAASYRWPARNADSDTNEYGVYNRTNRALSMGALLALPPSVTEASLNLQTPQGRKIFQVLQNYGAYVVDTSGGTGYKPNGGFPINIAAESSVVKGEFSFEGSPDQNAPWFSDMKKMLAAVKVVDNNTPGSIGGGGTPRQPLAPPFQD